MTTLKGWITTTFLAAALALSAVPANGGVIIGGGSATNTGCPESGKVETKSELGGVIIGGDGLVSVIIGVIGVIIGGGAVEEPPQNCGVIIGGQ